MAPCISCATCVTLDTLGQLRCCCTSRGRTACFSIGFSIQRRDIGSVARVVTSSCLRSWRNATRCVPISFGGRAVHRADTISLDKKHWLCTMLVGTHLEAESMELAWTVRWPLLLSVLPQRNPRIWTAVMNIPMKHLYRLRVVLASKRSRRKAGSLRTLPASALKFLIPMTRPPNLPSDAAICLTVLLSRGCVAVAVTSTQLPTGQGMLFRACFPFGDSSSAPKCCRSSLQARAGWMRDS
jgi:hypothetical protein